MAECLMAQMKRAFTVKVTGSAPFTMLLTDPETNAAAEHICRCIFGDRLEWVK